MNLQIRTVSPPTLSQSESTVHPQVLDRKAPLVQEQSVSDVDHMAQDRPKSTSEQHSPKEIAKKFNKLSDEMDLDIKFAYNDKIDQIYINVIDKHTGKVIRKLPSEESMKIAESMKELVGALFDKKG